MTAGRPQLDYTGHEFGLVTVVRRNGKKLWCQCRCGMFRYYRLTNLIQHPPKSHVKCIPEFQYELGI